jgi:hypothetical protein
MLPDEGFGELVASLKRKYISILAMKMKIVDRIQ